MPDALLERAYVLDDVDVDEAGRIATIRVVPYGVPRLLRDQLDMPERGLSTQPYREGWRVGAFRRAIRAPHRVPFVVGIAEGHEARRRDPFADVGRARALVEREDALYADVIIDRSPFGDATLAKIDSGQWRGISVGSVALAYVDDGDPHHGGIRWRTRAHLDHILLTEHNAFPTAEVMALREAVDEGDTPRLAHWRGKYPRKATQ
jgi:hypothetical protein